MTQHLTEAVEPPANSTPLAFSETLRGLRDRVTRTLTDSTRNNPLIYYRDSRTTRFTLPAYGSETIRKLIDGRSLRRADLADVMPPSPATVGPSAQMGEAVGANGSAAGKVRRPAATPADPWAHRIKAIRAKARENEEERGLRTLYAAVGMATWPAADGGRAPMAPIFLIPMTIAEDDRDPDDFIVSRVPDGEIVINRALLTVAPAAFADVARTLFEGGVVEGIDRAWNDIRDAARSVPTLELLPTAALGIFNFSMMAIVEDIHESGDALADHLVIRALAGDVEAQTMLAAAREGAVDVTTLDAIPPIDEPFVLDADPWQARAIQTLLKYPNSHATVSGPPGTGKSQTIANLIASLIAQGKTVLFACEKRAALEVVKRRLSAAGLESMMLDMHGAAITRQYAYAQLRNASATIRAALEPHTSADLVLESARATLNDHVRFMHTPLDGISMSPFQLLGAIATLPPLELSTRIDPTRLATVNVPLIDRLADLAAEAARSPDAFLRKPGVPWALAATTDPNAVPGAIDALVALGASLKILRSAFESIGVPCATRDALASAATTLCDVRTALKACAPTIIDVPSESLTLAAATMSSPIGGLLKLFSGARRAALRATLPHLRAGESGTAAAAITALNALGGPWRTRLATINAISDPVESAAATITTALATAEAALGLPFADSLGDAGAWIDQCVRDRDAAYRAVRMREIENELRQMHLGALVDDFGSITPVDWDAAVRYVLLQSLIEPLRPQLMRFDGRRHDDVVRAFGRAEAELREVSRDRVLRAACQRLIDVANALPAQQTAVNIELQKKRPRKTLRNLYAEAPNAMLALAPCVMASPLSISQFLPRASIFDVVIFDEGSQVTPESAVTAILRGRRVVIAGDERQLPPTDFFKSSTDDDEDEVDDVAITGTESILAAMRPFAKELDLRVHYRSRDERLIAFSNHYLYGDALITFPGAGADGQGLRFELVDPSGTEIDEDSSSPEVRRVVDLIIEHAEKRPTESLGVIALGSPHANRIETLLASTRRTRLDLDDFFSGTGPEPFFIKNLERVQGDERTAIILTIGYGRTKTGAVSHNFGPINHDGGERRLNVAVTRAKSRLTLVSSFRKADLNPGSLVKTGSKLLAAYLGYVESAGADLGRDGADVSVPSNPFESDIQHALEGRLGVTIIPQYGVGNFRIDLAVQHPDEPGRFVMAIECDGASYHSAPSARLRDRLRQNVLEGLGWTFCRVWSTDWFNNRQSELDRIEIAYKHALARSAAPVVTISAPAPAADTHTPSGSISVSPRTTPCPIRPPYRSIDDLSDRTLRELQVWIASDGRLRTNEEMISEMTREMGFQRRGARIVERLTRMLK